LFFLALPAMDRTWTEGLVNVVDVEATCRAGSQPPGEVGEITEIGLTVIDLDDTSAVNRIGTGRSRIESERWAAVRVHYRFDALSCIPGEDGAHEKGAAEHGGGCFRRTHPGSTPSESGAAESR
jgi:hypothetical protein